MSGWTHHRFVIEGDDFRPMTWPPKGPFWRAGETTFGHVVVCFWPAESSPFDAEFWPDAISRSTHPKTYDGPEFTAQFPCPEWWTP